MNKGFNQFGNNSNNYNYNNGGFNSAANNPGLFDPPIMNSSPYPSPAVSKHVYFFLNINHNIFPILRLQIINLMKIVDL